MTPLTAAERQAMREAHVMWTHKGWDYCAACYGEPGMTNAGVSGSDAAWPCSPVRLLDALDATEKERDEAREKAIRECHALVRDYAIYPGTRSEPATVERGSILRELLALLPQPDAPAATTETIAGYCAACGTVTCIVRCCDECTHRPVDRGSTVALAVARSTSTAGPGHADLPRGSAFLLDDLSAERLGGVPDSNHCADNGRPRADGLPPRSVHGKTPHPRDLIHGEDRPHRHGNDAGGGQPNDARLLHADNRIGGAV